MDWVEWCENEKFRLASFRLPEGGEPNAELEVNEVCLKSLERSAKMTEPNHSVAFIGDSGAGKSLVVGHFLTVGMGRVARGVTTTKTEGIHIYPHNMHCFTTSRERYHVHLIDTEGFNSDAPNPQHTQEQHNSYNRPAVGQLLPHFAYQAADLIVYVWSAHTYDSRSNPQYTEQADRDCVSAFRLSGRKSPNGGRGSERDNEQREKAAKPALLVLINRVPLRKCFGKKGGEFRYIDEEGCTEELLAVDNANGRVLQSHFSHVYCYKMPFRGSKWKSKQGIELTGADAFDTNIETLEGVVHKALTAQMRTQVQTHPRAILSELAWVGSLRDRFRAINSLSLHRWGVPTPPPVSLLVQWNKSTSKKKPKPPEPPNPLSDSALSLGRG